MPTTITVTVNGTSRTDTVDERTLLVQYLREVQNLTGTHIGCDTSSCGACTVHLDGESVQSCVTALSEVGEGNVTTIEGLSEDGTHPVQKAWKEHNVPQCGYCQVGQMMMASAMLRKNQNPSDSEIDEEMWNICRCGTYNRIRAAIKTAATEMRNK